MAILKNLNGQIIVPQKDFEEMINLLESDFGRKAIFSNVEVVVGAQHGDEGKGKVTDFLARTKDVALVIRSTGGANAGHTVVVGKKKYAMHLLPSSITNKNVISMIAPGVYLDPEILISEIEEMKVNGVEITPENFVVSNRAHMILDYHKSLDLIYECMKTEKIGTTKRGIGPAAEDKMRRTGIPIGMILGNATELLKKLTEAVKVVNSLVDDVQPDPSIVTPEDAEKYWKKYDEYEINKIFNKCMLFKSKLSGYIKDTAPIIEKYLGNAFKTIVIEGAQAHGLDVDHGDYPFVTSSNPIAPGACAGAGIGPKYVYRVHGIAKAYRSRVGEGPFETCISKEEPHKYIRETEVSDEVLTNYGKDIREMGGEYGVTTGRPRDCGFLDLVQLKEAARVSGVTDWCINHVDTIGNLGKEYGFIDVCVGYYYKGETINYIPTVDRNEIIPIYKTFQGGWSTAGCKTYEDLPPRAKSFLKYIEYYTGVPVKFIGTGPSNQDMIVVTD